MMDSHEREDEARRALMDEGRDPWGYDEETYPEHMAGMGSEDGVPEVA